MVLWDRHYSMPNPVIICTNGSLWIDAETSLTLALALAILYIPIKSL